VVNKALDEIGTVRNNVFLSTMGEDYIRISFEAAAAADADAELYYNEINIGAGGQGLLRH
jgi:endo-1,4-beta-xylanase